MVQYAPMAETHAGTGAVQQIGAFDMLSMPPATTRWHSQRRSGHGTTISAFMPEPQTLLMVVQGTL